MRARYMMIALVIVGLLAGGVFFALRGGFTEAGFSLSPVGETAATAAPTDDVGTATAQKLVDIPTPPQGLATRIGKDGLDSLTSKERASWEKYLADTAAVVTTNADAFRAMLDSAIAAIVASDTASLYASFAPDEDLSLDFAKSLVGDYPQIQDHSRQPTVGIFAVGKATVYFGYVVVRWQDAGIISEHTIAIPMRFVGGRWYLTSIGSGTKGLTAVQSVRIEN